jgi:hypothetical protein
MICEAAKSRAQQLSYAEKVRLPTLSLSRSATSGIVPLIGYLRLINNVLQAFCTADYSI